MDSQISKLEEVECNLCFAFHPQWARHLAKRRAFAFFYSVLSIVQGMGFLYIVTTITSVEQHFQLPSETLGIIMSIAEVMAICTGFVVGLLLGTNSHRPRAIGIALGIMGVGCQLFALPYYLYGSPTPLNGTDREIDFGNNGILCEANATILLDQREIDCKPALRAPEVSVGTIVALLLLAYSVSNAGSTAFQVIGTPFLDDNVQNKNSAMYLAVTSSIRTLGPVFGTLLGSLCLSIYVDPHSSTDFDAHDVRWVGAWWLGYVIMGILLFICAILIAQFPLRLPSKAITPAIKMEADGIERTNNGQHLEKSAIASFPSLKELWDKLRRILVNPLLWTRTLSATFTCFGLEGYVIYLPKYLEHEFHMTSSQAGLWMGCAFILPPAIGYLIVGYIIMRLRITARQLALGVIIFKTIEALLMISLVFIRCEDSYLLGLGNDNPVCDAAACECTSAVMSPICGSDGFSYFSACHAGCSRANESFDRTKLFDCACIAGEGVAAAGACDEGCTREIIYLSVVALSKLCLTLDAVAATLFTLRCVEPRDKTMAAGFVGAFIGLVAFIPCPLVFSAAVDSTCLVWSKQCNRTGACDVYDMDQLRLILHLSLIICLFVGVLCDTIFWKISKDKLSLITDEVETH